MRRSQTRREHAPRSPSIEIVCIAFMRAEPMELACLVKIQVIARENAKPLWVSTEDELTRTLAGWQRKPAPQRSCTWWSFTRKGMTAVDEFAATDARPKSIAWEEMVD